MCKYKYSQQLIQHSLWHNQYCHWNRHHKLHLKLSVHPRKMRYNSMELQYKQTRILRHKKSCIRQNLQFLRHHKLLNQQLCHLRMMRDNLKAIPCKSSLIPPYNLHIHQKQSSFRHHILLLHQLFHHYRKSFDRRPLFRFDLSGNSESLQVRKQLSSHPH